MITNEELQIAGKSYINKDFQTIYPELIQLFKTLTKVADPEAMNESDAFIVLLKLLAFVGDKTNFNVDKNILEAFLPSATQETSVRQILEMNGYTKKYYQSASTYISLLYQGEVSNNKSVYLAPFETLFTDSNNSITYTLLQEVNMQDSQTTYPRLVTEGRPQDLTINGSTSIQLSNLDDNLRLYFPETMVAQNRIFVKNEGSSDWNVDGTSESGWSQVNNLNLYSPKSKHFKFGFDSNKNLPYIQFPDDIIELIGSGLNVKYFITSGASGNVARGKLTVLSSPSQDNLHYYNANATGDKYYDENVILTDELNNQSLLRIFNYYASTNGADPETIDEAYNNYKKTVGTFDTLITPRDFANWLYTYIDPETSYPLINNVQVSDRRTDTTFYQPVVTYNEYGATTDYVYVHGKGEDNTVPNADTITPFDLVLYPLQQVSTYSIYDKNGNIQYTNYETSFKPSDAHTQLELIDELRDTQSVDHTYIKQDNNDPYLYKNYYKLNIKVSTIDKVNDVERRTINNNIKQALFDNFNSRKVDYGYEIPMDTLYDVVLNADNRIKNVSIDDPEITTKVMLSDGLREYKLLGESTNSLGNTYYIDMLARNILAGKVNMYEYLDTFEFNETMQSPTLIQDVLTLVPTLTLSTPTNYKLKENQVVQLFSDSFSVSQTATVGVNYYWVGATISANDAHEIGSGEKLYISYTNSDQVVRTYEYNEDYIITMDVNGFEIKKETGKTIISPSFQMAQTTGGTMVVNAFDLPTSTRFTYLSTGDEIGFLKKNEKTFVKDTYYFYWKLNNTENVLFPTEVNERILGEEEYFMYTDTAKASVEIFGSGTKISRVGLDNLTGVSCNAMDTSELIDGDLSTYAGIDWKAVDFSTLNRGLTSNSLSIKQQKVLTLTDGDTITYTDNITGTLTDFDTTDALTYQIGDGDPDTISYNALYDYKIRTRLDIVAGPNLPQTLNSGESILYTSTTHKTETTLLTGEADTFITNYPIQRSGNDVIDTKLSGDTFDIVTYTKGSPISSSVVQVQGKQYKLELKNIVSSTETITINVPVVSGYSTKFMIYFNERDEGSSATYTIGSGAATPLDNGVTMVSVGSSASSTTVTLVLTKTTDTNNYIIIDEMKVTNGFNSTFNLSGGDISALTTKINDLVGSNVGLYETYPIPYSKVIDVDDFTKPEVMWDKNNVLNRFTLPEIDFENSSIDVLKSSRK